MNVVLEILNVLACIVNVVILLLELYDRWKKYRHQQMVAGEKVKPSGH